MFLALYPISLRDAEDWILITRILITNILVTWILVLVRYGVGCNRRYFGLRWRKSCRWDKLPPFLWVVLYSAELKSEAGVRRRFRCHWCSVFGLSSVVLSRYIMGRWCWNLILLYRNIVGLL